MNTTTVQTKADIYSTHGGVRVHCDHGERVCTTKSGNARAVCEAAATGMARSIHGSSARFSMSADSAWSFPDASAAVTASRALMRTAPKAADYSDAQAYSQALSTWQRSVL